MSAPIESLESLLLARRVRGGARADESAALLEELVRTCGRGTLGPCLHYQGFATAAGSEKAVDRLYAMEPGDVIAYDLPRGVNVQRIVSRDDSGVVMRAADGCEELHPATAYTSTAELLARWRPATASERDRYAEAGQ